MLQFCDGSSSLSFIMGKSRLAPIKTASLPKLELNPTVGVRICQVIKRERTLSITTLKCWRDSILTFRYITNKPHKSKVYVANQISEILKHPDLKNWQPVDGRQNSADFCTRGIIDPIKLLDRNKYGNSWLLCPEYLAKENVRIDK